MPKTIDNYVDVHPEHIKTLSEVEKILAKIKLFESTTSSRAGVLYMQTRQFGSALYIISQQEAIQELTKPIFNEPRTPEWGLKFFPRAYFEALRERLKGNKDYLLPQPLTREQYRER